MAGKVEQFDLRTGRRMEPQVRSVDPNARDQTPDLLAAANGYAAWVVAWHACPRSVCNVTESLIVHDGRGTRTRSSRTTSR